jgi:hypothetical protein
MAIFNWHENEVIYNTGGKYGIEDFIPEDYGAQVEMINTYCPVKGNTSPTTPGTNIEKRDFFFDATPRLKELEVATWSSSTVQ